MSSQKASSVRKAFWFRWVLANTLGSLVGLMVGFVGLFIHGAFFGAIIGTLMGIMQWRVLREHISRAGSWAAACTVGGAVGGLMYEAFARADLAEVTIARAFGGVVLGALVGGFVAGAMQWLVLRQQVYRAGWWVLASTVGGAGGLRRWWGRGRSPGLVRGLDRGRALEADPRRNARCRRRDAPFGQDCGRARGPHYRRGRGRGDYGACADSAVATSSFGSAVRCR